MFDNLGTALVQALGFLLFLVFLYIKLYLQIANPKFKIPKNKDLTKKNQLKKNLKRLI